MPSQTRIITLKKYLSWNIVYTSHNLVSFNKITSDSPAFQSS